MILRTGMHWCLFKKKNCFWLLRLPGHRRSADLRPASLQTGEDTPVPVAHAHSHLRTRIHCCGHYSGRRCSGTKTQTVKRGFRVQIWPHLSLTAHVISNWFNNNKKKCFLVVLGCRLLYCPVLSVGNPAAEKRVNSPPPFLSGHCCIKYIYFFIEEFLWKDEKQGMSNMGKWTGWKNVLHWRYYTNRKFTWSRNKAIMISGKKKSQIWIEILSLSMIWVKQQIQTLGWNDSFGPFSWCAWSKVWSVPHS